MVVIKYFFGNNNKLSLNKCDNLLASTAISYATLREARFIKIIDLYKVDLYLN
jgi:hypothetical protein